MSKKPRNPDLAGWFSAAAGSEAAKLAKKRRRVSADFGNTVKPSRLARRRGRGK